MLLEKMYCYLNEAFPSQSQNDNLSVFEEEIEEDPCWDRMKTSSNNDCAITRKHYHSCRVCRRLIRNDVLADVILYILGGLLLFILIRRTLGHPLQ